VGKLVWLASYPKSGNTWLRAFLHNYINQPETPHSINRLTDLSVSECNAAFFANYLSVPPVATTTQDVQRARAFVHHDFTKLHDDLVFVKTHNANLALHGIPLCTPSVSAGAIYIVRDPRDVAVSFAAYTGRSLDDTIIFMGQAGAANRGTAQQVFELLGSWSAHVESWAGGRKILVLRYEDMLDQPAREFGKVIGFLGDDAEPARLAKAIEFSNFETLAQQEAVEGYHAGGPNAGSAFFRQGRAGQWRDILTKVQRQKIETDHADTMKGFSYL
jgi:hypothetical protein